MSRFNFGWQACAMSRKTSLILVIMHVPWQMHISSTYSHTAPCNCLNSDAAVAVEEGWHRGSCVGDTRSNQRTVYCICHSEFHTLRPHQWLVGEVKYVFLSKRLLVQLLHWRLVHLSLYYDKMLRLGHTGYKVLNAQVFRTFGLQIFENILGCQFLSHCNCEMQKTWLF